MKAFSFIISIVLLLTAHVLFAGTVGAEEGSASSEKIERLERLIKEQQQQLEYLQQQVNQLKKTAGDAHTQAKEAKSVAEEAKMTAQAPFDKDIIPGERDRVRLAISGQVNRAVNIVDDGKDTDAYFVDNDKAHSTFAVVVVH
ncbi:MAG: hypothetical protein U9Q19_11475, partial [Pseudomonadota bacterium]|nr:hypothetical protein [Pseudomonadota bacterium]